MAEDPYQAPVLVGHPFAPIGRGEDVRCAFRAFRAAGVMASVFDIYSIPERSDRNLAAEIESQLVRKLGSNINIFFINGDEVKPVLRQLRGNSKLPPGAFNIICPQWELSIYPKEWTSQLDLFDEVWAPSRFVFDTLTKALARPVIHMPLPVEVRVKSFLGRRYFGLPESAFLFLFFFDFRSFVERKNPFGILNAFEKLCYLRPHMDIRLVVKVNRDKSSASNDADFRRFIDGVNKSDNSLKIVVIDEVMSDNEVKNLIRCCNSFVSLHRSEGLGRGMAEAMFLGKPVIATAYSGNLDFTTEDNSCLVSYRLIDVRKGAYPFAQGQVWAEPDTDRAVCYMLKVLDDRDWAQKLGQKGSQYIRTFFSYRATGLRYSKRLEEINKPNQN